MSSEIVEGVSNLAVSSSKKMIVLKSSDGETFEVDEAVARQFKTVARMIEDDCADQTIPLENVTVEILEIVLRYAEMHVTAVSNGDEEEEDEEEAKNKVDSWDVDFMKKLDQDLDTTFHVLLAANYLECPGLLDLACQMVADHIKDKTPEECRLIFNIEKDFTDEEEEQIRMENAWTFTEP